ncbi:bacteriohemerythrin [Candidatus Neomarinimicrobiota bacterium]
MKMRTIKVTNGMFWVEVPEVYLYILCGCPADSVKHLMKKGLIVAREENGVMYETGPNAILLSDVHSQNGDISNLAEFPVLQMLYRQGMILPNHPGNTGEKPIIIGSAEQVKAQMEYIYRGNYGLTTEQEIVATGTSRELAREMFRMKMKFAFGKLRSTQELLDSRIIGNDPLEIKHGVTIRRTGLNVFEFQYEDETTTVNLNLSPDTLYDVPYHLGYHRISREYFAVIHSGEGDGWDINRPSMSSILMFQGKIYLIDAGPNLSYTLTALGIGANEIEGIFHTHAHDDHFAGITALLNVDHKLKYFATPLVRSSVMQKLSALTAIPVEDLLALFEVHDLEFGVWNNIQGLEVMPVFSPHPVETSIFQFRALSETGYRNYAHFADIASFSVLEKMVTDDQDEYGISPKFLKKVTSNYLTKADIKKLDIGGGLIHGSAEDFREDKSGKILLAHTARKLNEKEKEIGSGAPFGMVDVLIRSHQDYILRDAHSYLQTYFPDVPSYEIRMLLNNPVVQYNPETIFLKEGGKTDSAYLLLTGEVDMLSSSTATYNILSAGAFIADVAAMMDKTVGETYRASSFVDLLKIPVSVYRAFIKRNGLFEDMAELADTRRFLKTTWLFGEYLSYPVQNQIAKKISPISLKANQTVSPPQIQGRGLLIVKSGSLESSIDGIVYEQLTTGDFFMESLLLEDLPSLFEITTRSKVELYSIPDDAILDIPVVLWKLQEAYQKRIRMLFDPTFHQTSIFNWRNIYSVGIKAMDDQHKQLFTLTGNIHQAIDTGQEDIAIHEVLASLVQYTRTHFKDEERLMKKHGYRGLKAHRKEHERLLGEVDDFMKQLQSDSRQIGLEIINFLRDWIVNHILTDDRKYARFLNESGVS